jgi:hypothetical protein
LNRSEGGKLKDKISEPEQNKRKPHTFITKQTAKAVAQRQAHRIKEQDNDIATQKSENRVKPGHVLPDLSQREQKHQTPIPKHQGNSNTQTSKPNSRRFDRLFVYWSLEFVWSSEVGVWSFSFNE